MGMVAIQKVIIVGFMYILVLLGAQVTEVPNVPPPREKVIIVVHRIVVIVRRVVPAVVRVPPIVRRLVVRPPQPKIYL
jgi:hypothetical protein